MTPQQLCQCTAEAQAVAGQPEWDSPERPGCRESLVFLEADSENEQPAWALVPLDDDQADCVVVDAALAAELLKSHFRTYLLDRGWQVQVTIRGNVRRWRLVDCLSIADGGGDRLNVDYPYGDDELTVLCESVLAISMR